MNLFKTNVILTVNPLKKEEEECLESKILSFRMSVYKSEGKRAPVYSLLSFLGFRFYNLDSIIPFFQNASRRLNKVFLVSHHLEYLVDVLEMLGVFLTRDHSFSQLSGLLPWESFGCSFE